MSRLINHPSIRQFRSSETFTSSLTTLLSDPVMLEALRRLKDAITPAIQPEMRPGVHIDTLLAHEFQRLSGAQEALATLIAMSNPQPLERESAFEEEDFAHAIPQS